jgi:hypothetical protein
VNPNALSILLGDMQLSTDIIESIKEARCFLLREPERSRRVVRLLWANWLAHVDARDSRRPAVRALLPALTPVSLPLYPVSPDAPAGARALPPQKIASWLVATRDVKLIMEEGDVYAHATASSIPEGIPRSRHHVGHGGLSP